MGDCELRTHEELSTAVGSTCRFLYSHAMMPVALLSSDTEGFHVVLFLLPTSVVISHRECEAVPR